MTNERAIFDALMEGFVIDPSIAQPPNGIEIQEDGTIVTVFREEES